MNLSDNVRKVDANNVPASGTISNEEAVTDDGVGKC